MWQPAEEGIYENGFARAAGTQYGCDMSGLELAPDTLKDLCELAAVDM